MAADLNDLRQRCANPLAQPAPDALREAGMRTMDAMLADYLGHAEQGIGKTATRAEMERLLHEPAPENGVPFTSVLAEFQEKVLRHAYRPSHPRFLAFIPSSPTFESILGDCLTGSANLFAGVWMEAAGAAEVEIVVLDWFKQLVGYPAESMGLLTGGGSEANLTALVVARERLSHDERARAVLYASEHRHWSVDRAAKIIGMRPEQIRPLRCDEDFSLITSELRDAVESDRRAGRLPWVVVASAGTTNTGSVDPLAEIADVSAASGLWLHVDGAYGWPMTLTPEGRALLNGIERADSITLDPHKWFAQTFEAGGLLVRRGALLAETFKLRPEYMQDVVPQSDEINFCDHGIALTRRFRALKIWFSIKLLGLAWFRRLIEHGCALAEFTQALVERVGCFEITSRSKLSIVCFRYLPAGCARPGAELDSLQQAIAEELTRSGRAFLSTTRLNGRTTLRVCFVSWRTTAADVEEIVSLLRTIGDRLTAS